MTEIRRDDFKRPYVFPSPDATKEIPYQRVTTLAGMIEDQYNLTKWKMRQVVAGFLAKPSLVLLATAALGDKNKMDKVCQQAMTAAGAGDSAELGTAYHKLTELVDSGDELPNLTPEILCTLDAYRKATADLNIVDIELFVVNHDLKVGGTADRVVEIDGMFYILDVKTGKDITWGIGKIAMQLAIYANSERYDPDTGETEDLGASREWGIIAHLPAGEGVCTLHWVDLVQGWSGVQHAVGVRGWRKLKLKDLAHQIGPPVHGQEF